MLINKSLMLNMLFRAVADTLLAFGRNPANGLGGQLGIIAVLHTWDQKLWDHFHLHSRLPWPLYASGGDFQLSHHGFG
ncbi:MAG: hypothetical protein HKP58_00200 [Desulfatitalea sp.]|nr:hypothetical protein [Desulfatitalea sp.]